MAAVVIVLVIGRWRDIVFLTKSPDGREANRGTAFVDSGGVLYLDAAVLAGLRVEG